MTKLKVPYGGSLAPKDKITLGSNGLLESKAKITKYVHTTVIMSLSCILESKVHNYNYVETKCVIMSSQNK